MRKQIGLLLLAAALMAGAGCSAMLERSYVSATTHVDYYAVEEDPPVLRAETYQGLVNSILYFVESHSATGTIRLYNYTGDVEADLANACTEILNEDPLGAYAVRDIRYDTTRIVTYYEVNLSVIYSRSAAEVEEIQFVTGLTSLRRAFSDAISAIQGPGPPRKWRKEQIGFKKWQRCCWPTILLQERAIRLKNWLPCWVRDQTMTRMEALIQRVCWRGLRGMIWVFC